MIGLENALDLETSKSDGISATIWNKLTKCGQNEKISRSDILEKNIEGRKYRKVEAVTWNVQLFQIIYLLSKRFCL